MIRSRLISTAVVVAGIVASPGLSRAEHPSVDYSLTLEAALTLAADSGQKAEKAAEKAETATRKAGEVRRRIEVFQGGSFLGVGVAEVDSERAKALKLTEERGVEITHIEDNSPASRAGLQKGDVVVEYNGQRVEGTEQFVRLVRETPAGRQARLLISRNGATQTLTATVEQRKGGIPGGSFVMPRFDPPSIEVRIPDVPRAFMSWRSTMLGVEAESIENQLAEYFGVKSGVLVRSVMKGSAAEKGGLKAGDVITKIDGAKVDSPREITSVLRGKSGAVAVTLVRDRKESTVNVTLEERRSERPPAMQRPRTVRVEPSERL